MGGCEESIRGRREGEDVGDVEGLLLREGDDDRLLGGDIVVGEVDRA